MNIFRKIKKGFTIVELVIVVAVIAILTAILVPTFINLNKKANTASDQSLMKNLNTALRMQEQEDGAKNPTMHDAVEDLKKQGFLLETIVNKSDKVFLWNIEDNQFELENGQKSNKYWKIVNTKAQAEAEQHYSVYARLGSVWDDQEVSIKHGFDAGYNENIKQVTYINDSTSPSSEIIRTNGGKLYIKAKNGNVLRYGYADTVSVMDIAGASYHEKGITKFLEVAAGHIVLEQGSEVSAIHFTATGEGDEAKFENEDGKTISLDLSQVETDDISFSRDAVSIEENGTYVAEVTTDDTEYIWLFGDGIKEQMVTTTTEGAIATDGTLNPGIEVGAEDGSVAEQIANPASRNEQGQLIDENEQVIDISQIDFSKADALDDVDVVVEEVAPKEDVETGAVLFDGGTGSAIDPFYIVDFDTFQNVDEAYEKGYYSFKVKPGIASLDLRGWTPVRLNGNFDGNGVALNNADKILFDTVSGESSLIKNFTLNANISTSGGIGAVVDWSETLNLTLDSIDVHGTLIGANWVTPFVEFGPDPSCSWNLTIKNCMSDATLVATSGSASGFVGHPYDDVSNGGTSGASIINIIDSAFIGSMSTIGNPTSSTDSKFKYFTINGNDNRVRTLYSDAFIEKLGFNPEGTLYNVPANKSGYDVINGEDGSKTFFAGNYGKNVVDTYKPVEKKAKLNTTAQAVLPASVGSVFTVNKVSGAVKAVFSLQIAPNDSHNYGSYLGTYLTEEIDVSAAGATFTSQTVRYFTININSGVTSETGISGNIFNVVNPAYGINAHNGATVQIAQFDTNGNVLNITSVRIAQPHAAE